MKFLLVVGFLPLWSWVVAQNISDLNTGTIVELECEQSRITGTFVCAAMERNQGKTRVLLHRSMDQGATWTLVDSVVPPAGNVEQTEIPDPVLTQDAAGNFYMTCMRVFKLTNVSQTTVDLELYKSVDDGASWQYVSHPHQNDSIADYPQITADNNGNLHVVYSYITGFPIPIHARLYYKKSTDAGSSWSAPQIVGQDSLFNIGADIMYGKDSVLFITSGNRDTNRVDVFKSLDEGLTWTKAHEFAIGQQASHHITKPIMHKDYQTYGVISHRPHQEHTPIYYHGFASGNTFSQIIDTGAYAQGLMTDDGVIHVIYSREEGNLFAMHYIYSTDGGQNFTGPIVLYSAPFDVSGSGEYQAFFEGNDGQFYVAFTDWSDQGSAKMLVFPPEFDDIAEEEQATWLIYPNPAKDIFHIRLDQLEEIRKITIRTLSGKTLTTVVAPEHHSISVDLSSYPKGAYLVVLEGENRLFVKRLIKH